METVNSLKYTTPKKVYEENGETYRVSVEVGLDDGCNNGICDFHITGKTDIKNKYGGWNEYSYGSCNKDIERFFPELTIFISMRLCNHYGQPMYPVENGIYHFRENGLEKGMEYLRITSQAEGMALAACIEDKLYFKYQLYYLGIVDRWKREADAAIEQLEKLCKANWENPYTPEEERFVLRMTDDERELVEERLRSGYYSPESRKKREAEVILLKLKESEEKAKKEFDEVVAEAKERLDVYMEVIRCGIPLENVYYRSKELEFNWISCYPKITDKEFADFMEKVDMSKLPKDIKITLSNRREL